MEAQLEVLEVDTELTIEEVNARAQVKLSRAPDSSQTQTIDGERIHFEAVSDSWFEVKGDTLLFPGQKVVETAFVWDEEDIAHQLMVEWGARWQRHDSVADDRWSRVINFAKAFMPKLRIELEPISLSQWRLALKGFKSGSARGPDAWAREDLMHMSEKHQRELLELFRLIEDAGIWPQQMATAIVVLLKKHTEDRLIGEFRPISLFSRLYRVWASIRTKQVLHQIEPHVEAQCFGFLPKRSALQYFFIIQTAIELSLQSGESLQGFVADIVKAFNFIPRDPVYELARVVGVPDRLLKPWSSMHAQLDRRFRVRCFTSPATRSVTGTPEGDPLSCLGMVLCDMHWHCYMTRYLPAIHCISYADNLTLLSTALPQLVQGTQIFQCWLDAFDLQLDAKKSYTWSTWPENRTQLQTYGFSVKHGARDLGAQMQYGLRRQVASRDDRLRSVESFWQVLARSSISIEHKLKGIKQVLWPRALHASSSVLVPDGALKTLRTGAMRALRASRAGASPLVRLGFLHDPFADPDCFQWWQVLLDIRQAVRKLTGIHVAGNRFLEQYDGKDSPGPFGKLLMLGARLHWHLQYNFAVTTISGLQFHLVDIGEAELQIIFLDAWRSAQSRIIAKRPDFAGLEGVNFAITTDNAWIQNRKQVALLYTCMDGTFFTERARSHFDTTRSGRCRYCEGPDTWEHRLRWCPHHSHIRLRYRSLRRQWHALPNCLTTHGICPRVPAQHDFWRALQKIPDGTEVFERLDFPDANLFVDDSRLHSSKPEEALAAWAVTTTDFVVSTSPLGGLRQTISRAELTAFLSAVRCAGRLRREIHVWTDSQYVHDGFQGMVQGLDWEDTENSDLWGQVFESWEGLDCPLVVHKIWSHLSDDFSEEPFTDFWIAGNALADLAAMTTNTERSSDFMALHKLLCGQLASFSRVTRDAKSFILEIAEAHETFSAEDALESLTLNELSGHRVTNSNSFVFQPLDLIASSCQLQHSQIADIFGREFVLSAFDWLVGCEGLSDGTSMVSFLELFIGWRLATDHYIPVEDPVSRRWVDPAHLLVDYFRGTLAHRMSVFRRVCFGIFEAWLRGSAG